MRDPLPLSGMGESRQESICFYALRQALRQKTATGRLPAAGEEKSISRVGGCLVFFPSPLHLSATRSDCRSV